MRERRKLPFLLPPALERKLRSLPTEAQNEVIQRQQEFLSDPDFLRVVLQSPLSVRANDLGVKLLTGSQNMLLRKADQPSLDPLKVAQFLAWLAEAEPQHMNWVVQRGLEWLDIKRITRPRGRPRGRVKDQEYLHYFSGAMLMIHQDQLWEAKHEIRQKYPKNWRLKLQLSLQEKGWGPETVELLATAHNREAFAIKLVSRRFEVEYDTVAKAVRRSSKVGR